MSEKHTVKIDVYPKPYLIEVDADEFGRLFAHMNDDDQVQVLAAMELHMRPHRMQWDYIAIELEKDENSAVLEALQQAIPVDKTIATLLARIAELEKHRNIHKAQSALRGRILQEVRDKIGPLNMGLEDEGDRIYLGSTNDKDWLDEIEQTIMEVDDEVWAAINREETDPYVDLFKLNTETVPGLSARIEELETALETILCMHDGNPPMALADIPEIDYARRTISNIHRAARAALKEKPNA